MFGFELHGFSNLHSGFRGQSLVFAGSRRKVKHYRLLVQWLL